VHFQRRDERWLEAIAQSPWSARQFHTPPVDFLSKLRKIEVEGSLSGIGAMLLVMPWVEKGPP